MMKVSRQRYVFITAFFSFCFLKKNDRILSREYGFRALIRLRFTRIHQETSINTSYPDLASSRFPAFPTLGGQWRFGDRSALQFPGRARDFHPIPVLSSYSFFPRRFTCGKSAPTFHESIILMKLHQRLNYITKNLFCPQISITLTLIFLSNTPPPA